MKKSLLALAVLSAFAGAASAQSFVTISGKLDQGVGKYIGSRDRQVFDGASGAPAQWNSAQPNGGSRIGFFGREDLGSGLGAVFGFETRFNPDTGVQGDLGSSTVAAKFWNGFSYVGISSAQAGRLTIGRHYNAAFLNVQNVVDPFDGETTAALRGIGMLLGGFTDFSRPVPTTALGLSAAQVTALTTGNAYASVGAIGRVRVDNSLKYDITAAGISFGATIGESNQTAAIPETKRPYSAALSYAGGPIWVGIGYENPGNLDDKLINVGAKYTIGPVTLRGAYSKGTTSGTTVGATALAGAPFGYGVRRDAQAYLIGANVIVGSGNIKVGYATAKMDGVLGGGDIDLAKKAAVGYHYSLSKRTKLYVDFSRDSVATTEKTGYDLGIQHAF